MWAERADTLSDLPPPTMPAHPALSRARVSKPGSSSAGGVSKQEHRLLIAAKASVGAVIEEVRANVWSAASEMPDVSDQWCR